MWRGSVVSLLVLSLSSLAACLSISSKAEVPELPPYTTLNTTAATQTTSSTPTFNTFSTSHLSALNPPPGFGVNLVFDGTQALSPICVYDIALETLYRLSLHPWSSAITQSVSFGLPSCREQVLFEPAARGPEAGRLQTGYAVLALYAGVCAMTPPTRNLFYELKVMISQERMPVGRCTIRSALPAVHQVGSSNQTNTVMLQRAGSFDTGILTTGTGSMVDSEDPSFSLTWTFTGARLNSRDVFLAAMDGIAAAARFNPGKRCARLSAATPGSRSGAVINISSMKHPRRVGFSYQYASRALLLISRTMQTENRFGAMNFYLEYEGYKFGEGFIRQRVGLEKGNTAIEKDLRENM